MKEHFLKSNKDKIRKFRKEKDEVGSEPFRFKEKKRQKYIDQKRKQKRSDGWDG